MILRELYYFDKDTMEPVEDQRYDAEDDITPLKLSDTRKTRLTLKDIRTKVYPLTEDVRYKEWFLKYDALRTAKKRISDLTKPVVESGFGKPVDFDFPEK
jgi:hypothetical protein